MGFEKDRWELQNGGVVWLAVIDQQLAGTLFTRRGHDFRKWFVELQNEDIVIFRMRTYPEFRGRGIAPALMRYAMSTSLQPGEHAYIDCRIYNKPSIRSIQKAGFVRIASMKPLTRNQALG